MLKIKSESYSIQLRSVWVQLGHFIHQIKPGQRVLGSTYAYIQEKGQFTCETNLRSRCMRALSYRFYLPKAGFLINCKGIEAKSNLYYSTVTLGTAACRNDNIFFEAHKGYAQIHLWQTIYTIGLFMDPHPQGYSYCSSK